MDQRQPRGKRKISIASLTQRAVQVGALLARRPLWFECPVEGAPAAWPTTGLSGGGARHRQGAGLRRSLPHWPILLFARPAWGAKRWLERSEVVIGGVQEAGAVGCKFGICVPSRCLALCKGRNGLFWLF